MTSWSARMAEAVSARAANANSANSADRSVQETTGTNGTIGTEVSGAETAEPGELLALSALLAQPEIVPAAVVVPLPPCPATVAKRAALIEEGDTCERAEADRRALAEFGLASWRELADAHAATIRAELDRLPAPTSHDGRRLLEMTRRFLGTEHCREAIHCGWPLVELFGLHAHAPVARMDAWGVVTSLALSRLSPIGIERITPNEIVTACKSSTVKLVHRPGGHGMGASVVWWRCPALIGELAP